MAFVMQMPMSSSLSFKSHTADTRPFLAPRPAPLSRGLRTATIAKAKGPSLKPKTNIAKSEYDRNSKEVTPFQSAFTRQREIWAGRTAMTGFFCACIGELVTGKGALGQLQLETRLPQSVINWGVFAIVAFNFVTALNPFGPTFDKDNQQDVKKRPRGPTQKAMDPLSDPQGYLGTSNAFGFTKKNELFVGRVAMLGFASELLGELFTKGKGPFGQIGVPLGQPLNSEYAGVALAAWIGFFLFAAIGFNNFGQQEGNEEIY